MTVAFNPEAEPGPCGCPYTFPDCDCTDRGGDLCFCEYVDCVCTQPPTEDPDAKE